MSHPNCWNIDDGNKYLVTKTILVDEGRNGKPETRLSIVDGADLGGYLLQIGHDLGEYNAGESYGIAPGTDLRIYQLSEIVGMEMNGIRKQINEAAHARKTDIDEAKKIEAHRKLSQSEAKNENRDREYAEFLRLKEKFEPVHPPGYVSTVEDDSGG